MNDAYEKLVARISKASGLDSSDIREKVEAKKSRLSGLISMEGAAQIVAAELGINFDNEKVKIAELSPEMRKANVVGKITRIFPVREFKKNGREGKVASFFLGDDSSNIRVALWDTNHIGLIEKGDINEGDVVEIKSASVRKGEMHLSGFSDIKKSNEKINKVVEKNVFAPGNFKDCKEGLGMKVRAVVVQTFEPRFFDSKINDGEKGVLLNVVLDDGTETMRAVLFQDNIKKLIEVDDKDLLSFDSLNAKRQEVLGEEKWFSGNFRMNNFTGSLEMNLQDVEEINVDELIKEIENIVI